MKWKKSHSIMSFLLFNRAGLLYLRTAHHIQCWRAILTTTAWGIVSDQTSQRSQHRWERLYSGQSLLAFQESASFSKWKYESKDPEQEGPSQHWMEAFSTTERARESEQQQQTERDAESSITQTLARTCCRFCYVQRMSSPNSIQDPGK